MQNPSAMRSFPLTEPSLDSQCYRLSIIQQPQEGRAAGKEKIRSSKWPIDPPPVVEFTIDDYHDRNKSYLQSPFFFTTVAIEALLPHSSPPEAGQSNLLHGCLVSSLHKVKLSDNKEHGLFIFGDLNVKVAGQYRLIFTLYEMRQSPGGPGVLCAAKLSQARSKEFRVVTPKEHQSKAHRESTALTRTLCEAGVKLRIRKESSKRKAQFSDWAADKRQALMPPSSAGPMGPPHAPSRFPSNSEDVSHRFTIEPPGLGIRTYMDQENQHSLYQQRLNGTAHYQGPPLSQLNRASLSLPGPERPGIDFEPMRPSHSVTPYQTAARQSYQFDTGQQSTLADTYFSQPDLRSTTNFLTHGGGRPQDPPAGSQMNYLAARNGQVTYFSASVPSNTLMEHRSTPINGYGQWNANPSTVTDEGNVYVGQVHSNTGNRHDYDGTEGRNLYSHAPYGHVSDHQWPGSEDKHGAEYHAVERSTEFLDQLHVHHPTPAVQDHYPYSRMPQL